ncbi:MAG TPA: hypothetical protein VM184_07680, partial [Gaiellaceae bacterium]|nr:hypothetical protein [Gaiellaceae bacterium]
MSRLALLTEIPAPFRIPLFNALAERLDLHVSFLRGQQPSRRYRLHEDELRFEWRILPGVRLGGGSRWLVLNAGVRRAVAGADAVLLGGWSQPAFLEALVLARARKAPVFLWIESTLRDARPGFGTRVKKLVGGQAAAFVVPGRAAEAYVRSLIPDARVAVA